MLAFIPGVPLAVTALFGILGGVGGTAIMAQLGRELGRRKEPNLWKSWGGPPTTRLLRHRRLTGDITLTPGLRWQIEDWIGYPLPTEQREEAYPSRADTKYEEVVVSLREATRDMTKFPLVFAENANYGFRRNLWGLRPIGAPIAVVIALVLWILLSLTIWGRPWPDPWWDVFVKPDIAVVIRLAAAVLDTILAALWLFCWVKPSWVKAAADTYATRLMESVQTLRSN